MKHHQHKRYTRLPLPRTRGKRDPLERGIKPGTYRRRIIGLLIVDNKEYTLHATKGYRATLA